MAVNWRRGFFRTWIIATVVWIGAVCAVLRPDEQIGIYFAPPATSPGKANFFDQFDNPMPNTEGSASAQASAANPKPGEPVTDPVLIARLNALVALDEIEKAITIGITPPLMILALGAAIDWAIQHMEASKLANARQALGVELRRRRDDGDLPHRIDYAGHFISENRRNQRPLTGVS
jgi:hypothetical protein